MFEWRAVTRHRWEFELTVSSFRRCIAVACWLVATPLAAQETYPTKPVRVLVGFSPGGGQDLAARILGKHLGAVWSQPVVVENRAGANGMIAAEGAARAAPDGYTVHLFTANDAVNAATRSKLPYDTLRDLAPVTALSNSAYLLGVHPSLPVKTIKDLIALAKAKPGALSFASSGTGSPIHLSTELLNRMAGIQMQHVPYKGAGPALVDLVSGQVQVSVASIASFLQHVNSGRVRAVAVTGARRNAQLPSVPTVAESGLPRYEASTWNGIMVPAKTSLSIVNILNRDIRRLLTLSEVKRIFTEQGAEAEGSTPEQFGNHVASEIAKWGALVKAIGLQSEQ
jgi:tripartite-type tricarboxylate transporter receptor subunit TctC